MNNFDPPKDQNLSETFFSKLLDFYTSSMNGMITNIEKLASIQEQHPTEYLQLVKAYMEPEIVFKLAKKLSAEEGAVLLGAFLKMSILQNKMKNLYESTSVEKRQLASEIRDYTMEIVQFLEKKEVEVGK